MKRVDEAARQAYARDIGTGLETPGASSSSAAATVPAPKSKPPPKPSDPYANYTTAASLGIADPDLEQLIREADIRKSEGRAGDWVTVVPPPPPLPEADSTGSGSPVVEHDAKVESAEAAGHVRKRVDDGLVDEDDTRRFKMRKKTTAVGLGEIYDPGIIEVKPREVKEEPTIELKPLASTSTSINPATDSQGTRGSGGASGADSSGTPKWASRGWRRAGEPADASETTSFTIADIVANQKLTTAMDTTVSEDLCQNTSPTDVKTESTDDVKKEEPLDIPISLPSSTGLFKKRKVPLTSTAGRRKER